MEIIGYIAAALTTLSFLPQAILTIKTKDTSGISLGMYVLFVAGIAMWLVYGIVINDKPIIIANSITILLSGLILYYKILEDTNKYC